MAPNPLSGQVLASLTPLMHEVPIENLQENLYQDEEDEEEEYSDDEPEPRLRCDIEVDDIHFDDINQNLFMHLYCNTLDTDEIRERIVWRMPMNKYYGRDQVVGYVGDDVLYHCTITMNGYCDASNYHKVYTMTDRYDDSNLHTLLFIYGATLAEQRQVYDICYNNRERGYLSYEM